MSTAAGKLPTYDQIRAGLAELARVDDIKARFIDKAAAVLEYAKRAKDTGLIEHATQVKLLAEVRVGELLAEMKDGGERQQPGDDRTGIDSRAVRPSLPTLEQLGVEKWQSSRWQQRARLTPEQQEREIAVSTERALRFIGARPKPPPPPPFKRRIPTDVDELVNRCVHIVRLAILTARVDLRGLDHDEKEDRERIFEEVRNEIDRLEEMTEPPSPDAKISLRLIKGGKSDAP
jgi:hypothetical protein